MSITPRMIKRQVYDLTCDKCKDTVEGFGTTDDLREFAVSHFWHLDIDDKLDLCDDCYVDMIEERTRW